MSMRITEILGEVQTLDDVAPKIAELDGLAPREAKEYMGLEGNATITHINNNRRLLRNLIRFKRNDLRAQFIKDQLSGGPHDRHAVGDRFKDFRVEADGGNVKIILENDFHEG